MVKRPHGRGLAVGLGNALRHVEVEGRKEKFLGGLRGLVPVISAKRGAQRGCFGYAKCFIHVNVEF